MVLKKLFGNQIKILRKHKHFTQEKLSEQIGLDIRQLARIEAGQSFVTAETLEKLTLALEVSYKDLFDFIEVESHNKNMLSDSRLKYLSNYKKLNKGMIKIAEDDGKTEYLLLAVEAINNKTAREKLKLLLLGLDLK